MTDGFGQSSAPSGDRTSTQRILLLNGLQLLVVDDDLDSLDLITALLRSYGAEVLPAASAHQALDLLEHSQPDLLISDLRMPLEDGYSLIQKVRMRGDRDVLMPAIAVTACALETERQTAIASGYQRCICKPIDFDELLATVASLSGR